MPSLLGPWVLLLALEGRFQEAEAQIPNVLKSFHDRSSHHSTYGIAQVFALQGKPVEAVEWLRKTAATGMPNYTLFSRDPHLNRIRSAPVFVEFMAEMKKRHDDFLLAFPE